MKLFKRAIGTAVAVLMVSSLAVTSAACSKKETHVHQYANYWSKDDQNHWLDPICGDTDKPAALGAHDTNGEGGSCSVCGYNPNVIIPPEEGDTHVHTFATTWTKDETYHWYAATCEHTTLTSEKGEHDTNGAGGSCSVCGYVPSAPPAEHVHTYSEIWSRSTTRHWHASTCEHTGLIADEGLHDTNAEDGSCSVCGYKASGAGADTPDAPDPDTPATATYSIIFESNGGEAVSSQSITYGNTAARPAIPEYAGKQFVDWYTDSDCTIVYDFNTPVTGNVHLYAKWVNLDAKILAYGGYNESLYLEWSDGAPSQAKAYYKRTDAVDWTEVESPLVRSSQSGVARMDAVGLPKGNYNVKIQPSSGNEIVLEAPIAVTAYDRSGYAHFNHTEGVGAYTDDGSLKYGALVIYLTDSNKNNILEYAYCNGLKVDISQYMRASDGTQYTGIGELLNNRRYSGNDRANVGIARLCDVFGSVSIRVLGKVEADVNSDGTSTITGLTDYNSTGNGGSVGDNGRMARMCNAKNLTIEGIGEDASIYGWGLHFIASEINYKTGVGRNFEVRNIIFESYPEDAVGMEGEQKSKSASSEVTFPVEHCWVHNNVFYPGYCASPAESDKSEGDGSCDFKRGRYFTLSYNYFTDCHKTNLIGSASTSVQHCITMHHNWWNNCGSRIPLVRAANVHFYNNYIFGDMSATPSPSLSYVHSVRANAYLFSEANYYDGCKLIAGSSEGGGAVKAYNNQYHSCFNSDISTKVTNRTDTVSNKCQYIFGNIDYSTFDTNSSLFYYNEQTQTSDCLLDDAVTARIKVMSFAGVNGFGTSDTTMINTIPDGAVSVSGEGETEIQLQTGPATVNGVVISSTAKLSSGVLKMRGQGIFFTLASEAQITVTTTSVGDLAPDLLRADGAVIAGKFTGTLTLVLDAGTYFITSGQKEKDSVITALSFADTAASSSARLEGAIAAIEAIPSEISLEADCGEKIAAAHSAYSALTAAEKTAFRTNNSELYEKYAVAIAEYSNLQVENVIDLIASIGTVTKDSFDKISAAQTAYDKLSATQKLEVTNYSTLTRAEESYSQFAVQNVIDMIDELVTASSVPVGDRAAVEAAVAEYEKAYSAYINLEDGQDEGEINQQEQVTNIDKLTSGLETLYQLEKLFDFKDALDAFDGTTVTAANLSFANSINALYKSLSVEQIAQLTSAEAEKYAAISASLTDMLSHSQVCTFNGSISNDIFVVYREGKAINYKSASLTVNAIGQTFEKGMKVESGMTITVTVTIKMTLKIYVDSAGSFLYNGSNVTSELENGDNVITVELEEGTHVLSRVTGFNVYYASLTPAG